jgi:RHS repeat-associated protein
MYNASQGRAAMFWGGTQADKLQRRYRRFYAADGSMEITFDALGNKTTFVTYMGGDAYGAPAVWRSEQTSTTTEQYFYLFRDYLGSILAITDSNGTIKEKRIFDAWGEVAKLTDGSNNVLTNFTVLDRGYTGHEHLLGVGLVHMNGRLYDPKLHRFLMPDNYVQDPYNTQNFNRYGYVLNNPLSYTDPSGEIIPFLAGAIIGALIGATGYAINAVITGRWDWGGFAMSVLGGAISGAIGGALAPGSIPQVLTLGKMASSVAWGTLAAFVPGISVPIGDFSFNLNPALTVGNSFSIGAQFSASYTKGNFSVSAGITYGIRVNGMNDLSGELAKNTKGSYTNIGVGAAWNDGKTSFGYFGQFYDSPKQYVGGISFSRGNFGLRFQDDFPFGDQGDRFRTAAMQLTWKVNKDVQLAAGFSVFTGQPGKEVDKNGAYVQETPFAYRNGVVYGGINYRGRSFLGGWNSERNQNFFQNGFHDLMGKFPLNLIFDKPTPHFPPQGYRSQGYFYGGFNDPFGLPN